MWYIGQAVVHSVVTCVWRTCESTGHTHILTTLFPLEGLTLCKNSVMWPAWHPLRAAAARANKIFHQKLCRWRLFWIHSCDYFEVAAERDDSHVDGLWFQSIGSFSGDSLARQYIVSLGWNWQRFSPCYRYRKTNIYVPCQFECERAMNKTCISTINKSSL